MILTKIAIIEFILSIVSFNVAAGQEVLYDPLNGDNCYDVCTSRECNDAASTILNNMDPEIEPCIDFYKFACGGFNKATIPTYASSYSITDVTRNKINAALRGFFEADIEENETKPFALIKTFYKSCMNTEAINDSWYKRLREVLDKLGGWPLVLGDGWDESNFDWKTAMSKFRKIGDNANYFINYGIDIDVNDGAKRVVILNQPPTISRSEFQYYSVNNETSTDEIVDMTIVAVRLGADISIALRDFADTLDFEKSLYNIIMSVHETSDGNFRNLTTVAEFNEMYPGLRWKDYINDVLPSGITVDDNDIIMVQAPSYFAKLINLMSETRPRVLANFVFRKFVKSATYLIAKTEDPLLKPRWEQCVDIADENLSWIAGAMYVREYMTNETRSNVKKMFMEIRQRIKNTLLKQGLWMNEETRTASIEKAMKMKIHVGYPDKLLDDTSLKEYHANLTFTEHKYFGNMFNIASFVHYNAFNDLRKPPTSIDWVEDKRVTLVDGYYKRSKNAVRIAAGKLRDIFHGNDRPEYLNYGAVGTTIGHEIGHGIDDVSNGYDKYGDIRDFWESTTEQKYRERVDCMIDQYSNYMIDEIGLKVNITKTRNEMIADNIGIKLAYDAYIERSERKLKLLNVEDQRLNGLEKYSLRQMFWISVANSWCELASEESLLFQVDEDVHPIADYRVIGPLSNMEEFANDFQCWKVLNMTSHSRMIPKKRCSLFKSSNSRG